MIRILSTWLLNDPQLALELAVMAYWQLTQLPYGVSLDNSMSHQLKTKTVSQVGHEEDVKTEIPYRLH